MKHYRITGRHSGHENAELFRAKQKATAEAREKALLKAVAGKYRLKILREADTHIGCGLYLETATDIPELDAICARGFRNSVSGLKDRDTPQILNGTHFYTICCPERWFDENGWA